MPLSAEQEKALRAAAAEAGANPDEVVKAAEEELAQAEPKAKPEPEPEDDGSSKSNDKPTRPVADRLLIGFLPFIKVKELRAIWLGLPDSIPDDELTCSEYQLKHGAPPSGASSGEPEPE